jgi:hypothetical protein
MNDSDGDLIVHHYYDGNDNGTGAAAGRWPTDAAQPTCPMPAALGQL